MSFPATKILDTELLWAFLVDNISHMLSRLVSLGLRGRELENCSQFPAGPAPWIFLLCWFCFVSVHCNHHDHEYAHVLILGVLLASPPPSSSSLIRPEDGLGNPQPCILETFPFPLSLQRLVDVRDIPGRNSSPIIYQFPALHGLNEWSGHMNWPRLQKYCCLFLQVFSWT